MTGYGKRAFYNGGAGRYNKDRKTAEETLFRRNKGECLYMTRSETAHEKDDAWFGGEAFHGCGLDPEFEQIAKTFLLGDVENRGCLTDVQRALVTVAALTATQSLQHMEQYLRAGLRMGATAEQLRETIYQCAPYVGLERALCALEAASPVLMECAGEAEPNTRVTESDRFEKGLAVQQQLFGAENINKMRAAAPDELRHIQDYLSAHCFGDFYTRGGLDLATRELITFCAISCLGGCEPQATSHAAANLGIGNGRELLIDAVTQCLPFIGFPRTLNALGCIDAACRK